MCVERERNNRALRPFSTLVGWSSATLNDARGRYSAARAALADQAYLQQIIARIADDCQALYAGLSALPWLKVYPSEANFFLLRFAGIAAEALRAGLEQEGIVARWRGDMPDCLRVTAQQTAANDHLLSVLAGIDASLRQGTPVDAHPPSAIKGASEWQNQRI